MLKSLKIGMLKAVFLLLVPFVAYAASTTADSSETLTVTTYYPSPHGSYNNLQANYLLVNPQSTPIPATAQVTGTMVYNSTDNVLQYWNGTTWVQLLGSTNQVLGTFTKLGSQDLLTNVLWQDVTGWSPSGPYASTSGNNLVINLSTFGKGLYLIEWYGNTQIEDSSSGDEFVQYRLLSSICPPVGIMDLSEQLLDTNEAGFSTPYFERSVSTFLSKRNNQCFRLQVRKSRVADSKIAATVQGGFYIKITRLTDL